MGDMSKPLVRQIISKSPNVIIYQLNQQPQITKQYVRLPLDKLQSIQNVFSRRRLGRNMGKGDTILYGIDQHMKSVAVKCPLYTYKKLYQTASPQVIHQERKQLIHQFIIAVFRSEPFYFYSYQNTFYNVQKNILQFNPISTAGLLPIFFKKGIRKAQLKQVYELLDTDMFGYLQEKWSLVTHKTKFRAIGMFILHLILGKRVSLLEDKDVDQNKVILQKVKEIINQIPIRFNNLLADQAILKKIQKAMEEDNYANYLGFFRKVFNLIVRALNGMKPFICCLYPFLLISFIVKAQFE